MSRFNSWLPCDNYQIIGSLRNVWDDSICDIKRKNGFFKSQMILFTYSFLWFNEKQGCENEWGEWRYDPPIPIFNTMDVSIQYYAEGSTGTYLLGYPCNTR